MNKNLFTFLLFLLTATTSLMAQIVVTDADINAGETVNWTADNEYHLDGVVYVEDGATLNIEAGTVIKGLPADEISNSSDIASTLVIARGAQIKAIGTSDAPIIFTAKADDVDDAFDLFPEDRGLWGGVIVLGKGVIAKDGQVENGIEGLPAGETRALYGGNEDDDNSGRLSFVSIRHGGAEIAPGDEINGLTLGGVGSGTQIDHVEVYANSDDGIEWFGGTVDVQYAAVSFCGDDSFDWDQGWRGRGQFFFALQGADAAGNGAEMDGASPDAQTPQSDPTILNATFIGSGVGADAGNEHALLFRDGTKGVYANSIFTDFNNLAVQVENLDEGIDSYQHLENGDLELLNNVFWTFGAGNNFADIIIGDNGSTALLDELNATNVLSNPMIMNISRGQDDELDPRPSGDGVAYDTDDLATIPNDGFFTPSAFKGAFCNDGVWIQKWTALAHNEILGSDVPFSGNANCDLVEVEAQDIVVTDADINAGDNVTWTANNTYFLDGVVYVEDGACLTIEAGTVIKGLPADEISNSSDIASTLVIARGAQIKAIGTSDAPIIFTAKADDVDDAFDLFPEDRGLWGGVIVLGKGVIAKDGQVENGIEGLPAGETRALYGGNEDDDNSGRLSFVSIRHGGAEIAPGDEINGLTLGGVGSGTQIDHVEVYANSDDGIEWFGGTVDVQYAAVSFCGDDSFDWDQGWRGRGQFFFALQGADAAGNAAEMDGASPDAQEPQSDPTIYNATYIGSGVGADAGNEHALLFRDGTKGVYANSVFTDFNNLAVQVENLDEGIDSYQHLENGDLELLNNVFWTFGAGDNFADIIIGDNGSTALLDELNATNVLSDPMIEAIDRTQDAIFDPRPSMDGAAYDTDALATIPDDGFFTPSAFKGAFCNDGVWIQKWTALAHNEILGTDVPFSGNANCDIMVNVNDIIAEENGFILTQNYPNPVVANTEIFFSLPETANVSLTVYDLEGKVVATVMDNARMTSGDHTVTFNATGLATGTYYYTLEAANVVLTKVLVKK